MIWLEEIGAIWLRSAVWLAGLTLLFLVLTRFQPCNPGKNWWTDRRAALTDLVYWLLTPLVLQLGRVGLLVLGSVVLYGNQPPEDFALRHWPIALQILAILLIQDVLLYGMHRLFHTSFGWKFHAIHHSPETLDWTSTQRFHPVNAIAEFAMADAVVLLMGFSPLALAVLGPLNLIYSVMVHANLNWTFGPLRHVFASPVFHRWHHTSEAAGRDRNFAPTFPFLDHLFGTFYMPVGERPQEYGAEGVPSSFVGQSVHPFRGSAAWATRHPVVAGAILLALASGGYAGYRELTKPVEIVEYVEPSAEPAKSPILAAELRTSTAVAVNAKTGQSLHGTAEGRVLLKSGENEIALESHTRRVNAVAFSPNGNFGVSAGGDGSARVFDTRTGRALRTLVHGSSVLSIALADDGSALTAGVDGSARIWDSAGNISRSRQFAGGAIHACALNAEGSCGAVVQSGGGTLWKGEQIRELTGSKNLVYAVALRGDDLLAGDYDGRVLLWKNGDTAAIVVHGQHEGPVYCVAFDGDGWFLSAGADRRVRSWHPATLQPGAVFAEHAEAIYSVSGDGQCIAALGKTGEVQIWKSSDAGIRQTVGRE